MSSVIFDEDDTKLERGAKWVAAICLFVVLISCAIVMVGIVVGAASNGFKDPPKPACCQCLVEKTL